MTGKPAIAIAWASWRIVPVWCGIGLCVAGDLLAAGASRSGDSQPLVLEAPEVEVAQIQRDLERMIQAMRSLPQVAEQPVIGPRKIAAERAWRASQAFVESGDQLSTIRELNRYLNLVQTGEPQRYLVAQRQLAISHEKVGDADKAMRAALRYVASFISQNASTSSHADLVEMLRLVSRLMRKGGAQARVELKKFFAAMTSVAMPLQARMEVLVLAARAAGATGDIALAQRLLRDPVLSGAPAVLSGEIQYLNGLLAVASGRLEPAMSLFKGAIASFGSAESERRDRARLMLARVQMRLGQAGPAADSYSAIDELSGSFKDALFEGVYALIGAGRTGEARDQANIFRKQFASRDVSSRIRLGKLDTALAIKAGDWEVANKTIAAQRQAYIELVEFAERELSGARPLDEGTVDRLYLKHEGLLDAPDDLESGWRLFKRLAVQTNHVDDDRGDVRQLFFTLGRARLDQINPSWINTTRGLDLLVRRHLAAGHKLVGLERHLLAQRLNPVEREELQSLENRRNGLLGKYPETLARSEGWQKTADLFDGSIRLGQVASRLSSAQASLAAVRYLEARSGKESQAWREYDPQISFLRERASKAVEMVRSLQIENLADTGTHRPLRRLMAFYSMSLFDEEAILRRARNEAADTAERLLFSDFERAWNLWQQAARESYQQLTSLDRSMKAELARTVGELWQREEDSARTSEAILSLRNRISLWLGGRRAEIVDTIRQRSGQQIARLDQWSADIDAMRSERVREGARAEQMQFDAARKSARDEAMEFQAGGNSAWLD
ncbi:MAG: hypothetical protein RIQ81_2090 [Pseudomonadota bacterium]